ncbi:hypothetical protein [Bacillus pinisoli]|uniref:hypothetical protein n=1 Tax=Bacillus pinisoli TaxID=2901866 RepID=UPI001FF3AB8D|nr:hypothetical protein [Bacillus pinisoli]
MNKLILTGVLLAGITLGVVFAFPNNSEVVVSEGKVEKIYNSLDELEKESPLIVIGKKIDGKSIFDRDEEGIPNYYFTLSDFEVKSVIKNDTERVIDKKITILETAAYEENHDQLLSVNGYLPMEDNKKYILFLELNESENGPSVGSYNIKGVVFGKFAFEEDKSERKRLENNERKHYDHEVLEAHNSMIKVLEEKYSDYLN